MPRSGCFAASWYQEGTEVWALGPWPWRDHEERKRRWFLALAKRCGKSGPAATPGPHPLVNSYLAQQHRICSSKFLLKLSSPESKLAAPATGWCCQAEEFCTNLNLISPNQEVQPCNHPSPWLPGLSFLLSHRCSKPPWSSLKFIISQAWAAQGWLHGQGGSSLLSSKFWVSDGSSGRGKTSSNNDSPSSMRSLSLTFRPHPAWRHPSHDDCGHPTVAWGYSKEKWCCMVGLEKLAKTWCRQRLFHLGSIQIYNPVGQRHTSFPLAVSPWLWGNVSC